MDFPYEFTDKNLLENALDRSCEEFQRLEWLGDRTINLSVAKLLFQLHPHQSEANLSIAIGKLINNTNLAKVASKINQIQHADSNKQKADFLEALIGAVLVDADFATAFDCVSKLFQNDIKNPTKGIWVKDVKTQINELSQQEYGCLPQYTESEIDEGFEATCRVGDFAATGRGKNKSEAQTVAADNLLKLLVLQV